MAHPAPTPAELGTDDELPEGWADCELREVATMRLGKMLDAKNQENGSQFQYLRNVNVRWGRFALDNLSMMAFESHEIEEFGLLAGDVLICEGGEPGRSAVWEAEATSVKFQKAIHRVRCSKDLCPDWLTFSLQYDAFTGKLDEYFTGSTIKHFTGVSLARYCLSLPPLAEQRRIVAAVGRVLDKVSAARARLERVPTTLKRFRQAVLAAACSGRLTTDWRSRQDRVNVTDSHDHTGGYEIDNLPELPEYPSTWITMTVSNCSVLVQYGTSEKADPNGSIPLLRMGNL